MYRLSGFMNSRIELLFTILRHALLGKYYEAPLTESQFEDVLSLAQKQAIFGLVFNAMQNVVIKNNDDTDKRNLNCSQKAIFEAVCLLEQIKQQNSLVNDRTEMLISIFSSWKYRTCILKGQGVAQLYPQPLYRQSGDIDIWVEGNQDDILESLKENYLCVRSIDYVHSSVSFFDDVEVEVHFRPSWMYNPINNRKLQKYFKENRVEQFKNIDKKVGFSYPSIKFNLVYSLIHIYRHVFGEGIGLRQLVDYFYILQHSTQEERNKAFEVLCGLSLRNFTGAIMYIEKVVCGIDNSILLCAPNVRDGEFLLKEILRGGNFGQYDDRNKSYKTNQRFKRGLFNVKRNLRFLRYYPSEVLWIPAWKLWHWCWRKNKGYL